MDDLLKWTEQIHHKVKIHKQRLECHSHILEEAAKPWPLEIAPEKIKRSFQIQIDKQTKDIEKSRDIVKFDQDLQDVENLLQKARLLTEKEQSKASSQIKPKENDKLVNSSKELKPKYALKQKSAPIKLQNGSKPLHTKRAASNKKSSLGNVVSRQNTGKVQRQSRGINSNVKKVVKAEDRQLILKNNVTSSKPKPKEGNDVKDMTSDSKVRADVLENNVPATQKEIVIDKSKIRVNFSDLVSDIRLPAKLVKLKSTYTHLKEQVTEELIPSLCVEEKNFITDFEAEFSGDKSGKWCRSLGSYNREMEEILSVCCHLIAVLTERKSLAPNARSSKIRWSSQEELYFDREIMRMTNVTLTAILQKFNHLNEWSVLDEGYSPNVSSEDGVLSKILPILDDLDGHGSTLPYPATNLLYQNVEEVKEFHCERLRNECLIMEKNLVKKLTQTSVPIINHFMKSENSLDPELIRIFQNSLGVLSKRNILLPAFVVAE